MKKGEINHLLAFICGTFILVIVIVFGIFLFHKIDHSKKKPEDEGQIENTKITSSPMIDEELKEFLDKYGNLTGGPRPDWAIQFENTGETDNDGVKGDG